MEHDEQPCPEDNEVIDVVSWSVPPPSEESKLDQPKTTYNLRPRPTSLPIRALEIPQHLADSVGAVAPRGGVAEVSVASKVRKLLDSCDEWLDSSREEEDNVIAESWEVVNVAIQAAQPHAVIVNEHGAASGEEVLGHPTHPPCGVVLRRMEPQFVMVREEPPPPGEESLTSGVFQPMDWGGTSPPLIDLTEEEVVESLEHHGHMEAEQEVELTGNLGLQLRRCVANLQSEVMKSKKVINRLKELVLNAYALEGMLQQILYDNGGQ